LPWIKLDWQNRHFNSFGWPAQRFSSHSGSWNPEFKLYHYQMAILIDETKRVLVQGITGSEGQPLRKLTRAAIVTTVTT